MIIKLAQRYVLRGKMKSLAAFVGILISTFLMSIVIVLCSSMLGTLESNLASRYGDWHFLVKEPTSKEQETLQNSDEIVSLCKMNFEGYITAVGGNGEPVACLYSVEGEYQSKIGVSLIEGEWPSEENDIVISEALAEKLGITEVCGTEGSLSLHEAIDENGDIIDERNGRIFAEQLYKLEDMPYTIVGIYQSARSAEVNKPATLETVLTCGKQTKAERQCWYVTLSDADKVYRFTRTFDEERKLYNKDYLDGIGVSEGMENSHDNVVMLCTIMIVMVLAISVLFVGNAFYLSVTERYSQLGLLVSLGATTTQISLVLLIEVVLLAVIAIPLGLLLSLIIASVGIDFLSPMLERIMYVSVPIKLRVNASAILISILVAFVAALGSMIPLVIKIRKASPLEVLSNRKAYTIKDSIKATGSHYGILKLLAYRNWKINKSKFLSSIISLVSSLVILFSATVLLWYSDDSLMTEADSVPYDILVSYSGSYDGFCSWYEVNIRTNEKISRAEWVTNMDTVTLSTNQLPMEGEALQEVNEYWTIQVIEDSLYDKLLQKAGLSENSVDAIVVGKYDRYDDEGNELPSISAFSENEQKELEIYKGVMWNCCCLKADTVSNESVIFDDAGGQGILVRVSSGNVDWSMVDSFNVVIGTEDFNGVGDQLVNSGENVSVHNVAKDYETQIENARVTKLFVRVFVTIVCAIAIITVFFSVISNVLTRRREFAVISTMGMESGQRRKLFLHECLINVRFIVLGSYTISLLLSCLIYISMQHATYYFPLKLSLIYTAVILFFYLLSYLIAERMLRTKSLADEIKMTL